MNTATRSRIMRLSWQIQKRRKSNRSKSLYSAWAIYLNEDLTVYHLTHKHSHDHYTNKTPSGTLTLFYKKLFILSF